MLRIELKKYKMENLKVYGLNFGAIIFSAIPSINENLQTVVLILTIIWTGLQIIKSIKK
jgi:hypothetical protein